MNTDIKAYAKNKGVKIYEIAIELGISQSNLYQTWLHTNLNDEKKDKLYSAIDSIELRKNKEKETV